MSRNGMKVGGRLLLAANILAANAAAFAWAVSFAFPRALGTSPGELPASGLFLPLHTNTGWIVLLAALTLLGCNGAYLLRRRLGEPPGYVLSEAPGGAVRVSRDALETGLRSAGEALPEITRLRVSVESDGAKKVRVRGQFQCPEGIGNLEASRLLRQALDQRFAEMVQLGDGTRVEMQFEFLGFAGKLTRKATDDPPEPEPDEPSFSGPRYPIDDDDEERGE